jgi:ABC-2 type transport system permease protein
MNHTLAVFLEFMYRDMYVYAKRIRFYITNYVLLYPFIYIMCYAYLTPNTYKLADTTCVLMISLLSGNLLLILLNLSFSLISPMLFDRQQTRFIDYQIRHLPPYAFLAQQITFTTLFTFLFVLPFFPVSKLLLWHSLDLSRTSWLQLIALLLFGSLCCNTYTMFAICMMSRIDQIKILWVRVSIPLFMLGGFWAPWHTIYKASPLLGYLMLLNPFIYVTEGLRFAITGSADYFSAWLCVGILVILSLAFFTSSWYFFNKRLDPV